MSLITIFLSTVRRLVSPSSQLTVLYQRSMQLLQHPFASKHATTICPAVQSRLKVEVLILCAQYPRIPKYFKLTDLLEVKVNGDLINLDYSFELQGQESIPAMFIQSHEIGTL